MMGSESGTARPAHEVTITKPFYMGVHEITLAQWKAIMGAAPFGSVEEDSTTRRVSWEDCQRFAAKFKQRLAKGQTCRLPTEAEWEYACRAGSKGTYCFGDSPSLLGDYAWFKDNSGGRPHPVGRKKPNAWGLYDMHGNVFEWCADWFGAYGASAVRDPIGPGSGEARVLRGGGYGASASMSRSAVRLGMPPTKQDGYYGFRLVVEMDVPR